MWPTALPASVSLIPMQNRPSPLAAIGSHRSRSASVPRCSIARGGPLKISWARIALDTSARAELLEHDRGFDVAEAGAAPPLADRDAEQLGLAHAVPRPLREFLGLVAVACHRRELALGDIARELAQRGLVLGVGERVRAVAARPSARSVVRRACRTDTRVRSALPSQHG